MHRIGHPNVSVRVEDEQIQLINENTEEEEDEMEPPTRANRGRGGMSHYDNIFMICVFISLSFSL